MALVLSAEEDYDMAKKKGIPGVSFSAKRALGVTRAKQKIARKTGIPTTKSGRQRKMGAAMGGCVMYLIAAVAFVVCAVIVI